MKLRTVLGFGLGFALSTALIGYLKGRAEIDRHVDDYRAHWEGRRPHPEGVLHYVALGDSAAQGVGASQVEHGYVPRIGRKLAEATGREVVVTNLSVSGATSADLVRDQLPLLRGLPFTPDLVTLDIGGNDVIFPGHMASTFEENLDVILDALPPGSFVADVPWFIVPVMRRSSQQLSQRAAAVVQKHGHHLVPLYRATREAGTRGYYRGTSNDLFHPNDVGYEAWASTFWATIEASGVLAGLGHGSASR